MIIYKKRIRNIFPYIRFIKNGEKFSFGIKSLEKHSNKLSQLGFGVSPIPGTTVLPPAMFGPISLFNAEGKHIKRTDLPMETAYSQRIWHWKEFHGPYERVPKSKIVDVPYKRYPRDFVPPPSIQLTVSTTKSGERAIMGPVFEKSVGNEKAITHAINLFLEIFGQCQFFTADLDDFLKIPVRTLNWKVLPPGKRPWPELHTAIKPIINKAPKGNQTLIEYRLEKINSYNPDFAAVGEAGFHGYIILGFTDKKIFTLESLYYGNATYIFGNDWEELSKKTKADVLNNNLQKDRIIHREGWTNRIEDVLREKRR